jgi:hypothetical protein
MRPNVRNHVADLVDPRLEQLRAWSDAPFAEGRARINNSGGEHLHGRDDRLGACGGGFLGGMVRSLSDDLSGA